MFRSNFTYTQNVLGKQNNEKQIEKKNTSCVCGTPCWVIKGQRAMVKVTK